MRYHTAPLISEADIDVDIPNDVSFGMSASAVPFDYFNSRVQLAFIQAQLYEQVYANNATPQKLAPEERRSRIFLLDTHLESWRNTIPGPLQMDSLAEDSNFDRTTTSGIFTHMAELYFTYMSCLVRVHGIWSHEAEWLNCIGSFEKQVVHDSAMPRSRCATQLPPLPTQWETCVKAARGCLRLAHSRPFSSSNKWYVIYTLYKRIEK